MNQISIIIPVYNAEKTLTKCLSSISAQTYQDFEVLLINDGSKDTSVKICEEFCKNDSRFRLINQENAGPSAARNRGIDEANSKYLAFVDSDDYIEPNMLYEFYTAAEESNADITVCGWYIENSESQIIRHLKCEPGVYRGQDCRRLALGALDVGPGENIPPYSWVRFVRSECLENPRLRFNTEIYRSEDYLLWNQVFFRINCVCLITDKPLYHYVSNDSSITHRYIKNYWDMSKKIYAELKNSLPAEKDVYEYLNFMFLRRAYLAMSIATLADNRKTFAKDIKEILSDKDLRKVVASIPLFAGIKKERIRYTLLKFRMYFLIKIIFNYRYHKSR